MGRAARYLSLLDQVPRLRQDSKLQAFDATLGTPAGLVRPPQVVIFTAAVGGRETVQSTARRSHIAALNDQGGENTPKAGHESSKLEAVQVELLWARAAAMFVVGDARAAEAGAQWEPQTKAITTLSLATRLQARWWRHGPDGVWMTLHIPLAFGSRSRLKSRSMRSGAHGCPPRLHLRRWGCLCLSALDRGEVCLVIFFVDPLPDRICADTLSRCCAVDRAMRTRWPDA